MALGILKGQSAICEPYKIQVHAQINEERPN